VPFASADAFRSTLNVNLTSVCIGYLGGTSPDLLTTLQRNLGLCVRGPLPLPPGVGQAEDVLTVVLESEVAVSFDGLWKAGLVSPNSRCVV